MRELSSYETSRLAVQEARDSEKTQDERNRIGQFATPTALALDILDYSTGLLQANESIQFLDPAIGTGSFYSAMLATVPLERITKATGFEIDDHYGHPAKTLWADTLLQINLADFTKANVPQNEGERFNLLVCNPPYVRHHHLSATEKLRLQEAVLRMLGVRLSGLAGLYCYFMCLAHDWMTKGGLAAWLIPSEFMDVNYGRALKRYLLDQVTLLRVHRSDPNDLQFHEALVSSAIVWFRRAPPRAGHVVEFSFGGNIRTPNKASFIELDVLRSENKWTRFPMLSSRSEATQVKIGDLFTIKRGLATGANRFFILPIDKIDELRLPREVFRPILPSPRYLTDDEVHSDQSGNPILS
ncbi:MAG TPA: SAM-dependent DNA methyltransferase, partial [Blastocatellia bacterium]|nr:SAM-dependent DNA methyltransferase [Blastocatellia bacterium]